MILQNISRAIRTQNWFAVVLEFVIVIAGVVIGFQISAWADERAAEMRRNAALERLHDEAEQIVAYHRGHVQLHERMNALRTEAIERLQANDWSDANPREMAQGLNSVGILPAAFPPRSVYDELINAGEFSEIGSPELRAAIGDYHAQLTFLQAQIDYIRLRIEDPLFVGQAGARLVYAPDTVRERRWEFDFDVLSRDDAFLQRLLLGNNSQRAVTEWTRRTLGLAQDMCTAIAERTGRPCNPPEDTSE
ncbi:hypothetical protein [Maricaulis sp.]|uniref:hypothetical protein n=1 Tax=Maricaulis sp. TaxID=1486257 RepID=UPI00262095D4|nr:hypothetical protein [Maricaulis sp.]